MAELDPKKLQAVATLPNELQFTVCRFSPDGDFLFAAGYDGRLYRWHLESRKKESFDAHRGWVEAMVLHPDKQRLFTADSWGQVHCWEISASRMKPLWSIESACGSWLRSLTVSTDGRSLATCGNEPIVRLFSADGGKLVHELRGHEQPVFSVAFTPDGTALASGDRFGNVRHWDVSKGKSIRELDARRLYKPFHHYQQGGVRAMTYDPSGNTLYCAGFEGTNANQAQGNPMVIPFDWKTGVAQAVMTPTEPFIGPIMDIAFHPQGYLMATGSSEGGGAIWFWKPGEAKSAHRVTFQNSFRRMDLSPDGKRVAIAAFGDLGGQRGGNGRRLNKGGEYVDFGGSVALYAWA
jgi:WD40 repeat protein